MKMKKHYYDDYDYTEAYQVDINKTVKRNAFARFKTEAAPEGWPGYDFEKEYKDQCKKLEEWELERLVREGKVKCIYRTSTIKSKNVKSGTTLLEAQVYPSFFSQAEMPQTKLKRETKPSQKNLNDKNSRRYLIRLACINFGKGDIWGTFGWDDAHKPGDMQQARKDVKNFIAKINRRQKKAGRGNIKYIYIIAVDDHTRPHFHILMTGDGIDRDELEGLWDKCQRCNTRRIKPDDDFLITGLATYISNNPHGTKRWCSSKNLVKPPEPQRSYSKFKTPKVERMAKNYEDLKSEMEKAYPGFKFLDAEVKHNGVTAAFYIYARMVRN